jgi:ethanolamine utilization protein EutQ (cupin superfamily)
LNSQIEFSKNFFQKFYYLSFPKNWGIQFAFD